MDQVSYRKRNTCRYIARRISRDRHQLETFAADIPDSFVSWESQTVFIQTPHGIRGIAKSYVLWVKQEEPHLSEKKAVPDSLKAVAAAALRTYGAICIFDEKLFVLDDYANEREILESQAVAQARITEQEGFVVNGTYQYIRFARWIPYVSPDLLEFDDLAPAPSPEEPVTQSVSVEPGHPSAQSIPPERKHKNITRIDHPKKRTFGYFVRVQWKAAMRTKFFSDTVCGDRQAALNAAIAWRDHTEREVGKPRTEQPIIHAHDDSKTTILKRMKEGYPHFIVSWTRDGKRYASSVSITKHGEQRAMELALALRTRRESANQD